MWIEELVCQVFSAIPTPDPEGIVLHFRNLFLHGACCTELGFLSHCLKFISVFSLSLVKKHHLWGWEISFYIYSSTLWWRFSVIAEKINTHTLYPTILFVSHYCTNLIVISPRKRWKWECPDKRNMIEFLAILLDLKRLLQDIDLYSLIFLKWPSTIRENLGQITVFKAFLPVNLLPKRK